MHWRHKNGLEYFARAKRPLTFHQIPRLGEATWKAFIEKGWIEPVEGSEGKWWQRPHRLTDAGVIALDEASTP